MSRTNNIEYMVMDQRYEYSGMDADVAFSSNDLLEACRVAISFGIGFTVVKYNIETEEYEAIYTVSEEGGLIKTLGSS